MHHAAINAELAHLRHARSVEARNRHDVDPPETEARTTAAFLDGLHSLAAKLLPELHVPVHRSPRAAGSA